MRHVCYALIAILLVACEADITYEKNTTELQKFNPETLEESAIPAIESALGGEENPYARVDFDLLKYRDPATGKIPHNTRMQELEFIKTLPVSRGFNVFKNGQARNVNAQFTLAGPYNVGGRSRAIAIDVADENILFAGGVSGGLWRSTDQGDSWTRVSGMDELPNIRYIHQDTRPGHTNEWYYSTGEILPGSSAGAVGAPYRGNGMYKSVDNGLTWNQIPSTATAGIESISSPFNYVNNIAQDFSNTGQTEIYAAALGGIYRTLDGFGSHQLVIGQSNVTSNNDGLWTEVEVTGSGIVFATISNYLGLDNPQTGIFRSETGTAGSFEDITPDDMSTVFRRIVIGTDPSNENIAYFLVNSGAFSQLFKYDHSQPAGNRWTNLSSSLPDFGGQVGDYEAQGSYNMLLKVHPENSTVVFIGGTNLYRSTNGFADKSQTDWIGGYSRNNNTDDYFGSHADQHNLVFFPSDTRRALNGHDGGVSITEDILKETETDIVDGNNNFQQTVLVEWELKNNGYLTSQFYSVAIDPVNVGNPALLGGMQDNSTFITQDENRLNPWFPIGAGDGGYCFYEPGSAIISAQLGNIFRLIPGSGSSANISTPNVGDDDLYLFIPPIVTDPVMPFKVFVGTQGRIYYTLDVTKNPRDEEWFSFGSSAIPGNERVSAIAGSESPQGVLYIGTESGTLLKINNSTALDGIQTITGSQFPRAYISSIAVDPRDADHVVVTFSNYNVNNVFATTDGGQSWQLVQGNLANSAPETGGKPSVRWATLVPNGDNASIYLLGTSVGLFSTESLQGTGTTWSREAVNTIGTMPIDMITVRQLDGQVVVATHGNGMYEANLDLPLQAKLQLKNVRCTPGEVTIQANVSFTSLTGYNLTYEWFANGVSQGEPGEFPIIRTESEGTYQVRITNTETGESDLSNEIVVDFDEANAQWCSGNPVASIEDELQEGLLIYPNPTFGEVTLSHDLSGEVLIELFSITGARLNTLTSSAPTVVIDLSDREPGTYLVVISNEKEKISKRIIKK